MAIVSVLFNTGLEAVYVSFNRGPLVPITGIAPPFFRPNRGYPPPGWDVGGPSSGNLGPGDNLVSLQTSGVVLPVLTLRVPNISPGSIQSYLLWSYDPHTGAAELGATLLDAGSLVASASISGNASPIP